MSVMDDAREQAFTGVGLLPRKGLRRTSCAGKGRSPQAACSSGVPIPRSAYCASPPDAAIMRCPKTGCGQSAIEHVAGEVGASHVGQDLASLVWATAAGDVRRVAK